MKAEYGKVSDIEAWMKLVNEVRCNFPGLETEEEVEEHKNTVLRFMNKNQALCVKQDNAIVGVLLFSYSHNIICCLAILPEYRRIGVASVLLREALNKLDSSKEISVSTFRKEDPKGTATRALYEKFGFREEELIEEFGYPNQRFVLYP